MVQKQRQVSVEDGSVEGGTSKQLFVDEHGFPIAFFLHKSIKNTFQRGNVIRGIQENGGIVLDDDEDVDTVLVDKALVNVSDLQLAYSLGDNRSKAKIYVEHMGFVSRCIRNQQFRHMRPIRTGMGGPGRLTTGRTPFTEEDEHKMCQIYARRMPDEEAGGRLSLGLWKEVCGLIDVSSDYEWTSRHTPQSWLEHYKKKKRHWNKLINKILKEEGRPPEKNLWPRDRRLNGRGKNRTRRNKMFSESEESSSNSISEDEDDAEVEILEDEEEIQNTSRESRMKSSKTMLKEQQEGPLTDEEPDFDNVDGMNRNAYEADLNQAGPSGTLQPPSPTLVERHANLSATRRTDAARNNTQEFLSQRTLVGSNSVPSILTAQNTPAREVASQSNVAASSRPSRQTNTEQIHPDDAQTLLGQAPPEPARILRNRAFPSNQRQVTAIPVETPKNVPQPQSSPAIDLTVNEWTSPKKNTVSKRAKLLRTQPQSPVEAPYRNTRSRSRSMEPLHQPPAKKARRAKEDTPAANSARLPPLEEAEIEDPVDSKGIVGSSISATVVDEEMVVEDLLMVASTHQSNASAPLEQTPVRQSSLETDDAQTRQMLHGSRANQAPLLSRHTPRKRPDEMLQAFTDAERARSRNYSASGLRSRALRTETTRPRKPEPFPFVSTTSSTLSQSTLETPNVLTTPQQKKPSVTSHKRGLSVSSVESFPVAGTRASTVKKSVMQKEKQTPYKPPAMTRAARFVKPQ